MRATATLLAFSLLHVCLSVSVSRPTNWLGQCRASTNPSITALEALPGGGWDNLRNIDMGRVMNLSYFHCQTTEDGFYFIPDEVFVIPHKETGVETNSEIISSWQEQRSSTSHGINADASFFSRLNGKYSSENQRMKIHQVKESSTTTKVQVRNLLYTVRAYPDFSLDSRFAQQAKEIAEAIENNQTRNANYLSEKMVFDYGTHVITSVDAGATLVEEDYLHSSYVMNSASKSSAIKVSAGLNFFDKLKFDISSQNTQQSSSLQEYQSNIQYSLIQSHGSIPFYPGITLQKWQESTRNNLVAVDRLGVALPYFINTNTFPDLPQPTVNKVAKLVTKATERYYKVNTRPGCVDVNSQNFNFQANIDDASCDGPATNLSFGGVYQECIPSSPNTGPLCDTLAQKNPDTGAFSCQPPYSPTLLRSEVRQQAYTAYECHDQRYKCWLLFHCKRQVCRDNSYVHSARINTYWCSFTGKAPEYSGYLFGGMYSPSLLNPITNSKTCPENFIPLKFLSDGQVICLSKDYETGTKYAVPFAGFFSCQSNNPMAGQQHRCPPKFSQHLAAVSDGCEILYCVQSGLFTGGQLLPIHLPPFTRAPILTVKATDTVMVMTEDEKSWVRVGNTKAWKLADPEEVQGILRNFDRNQSQMSSGEKAGVAFGVMGVMALVLVGVVVLLKRRQKLPGMILRRGYAEIRQEEPVGDQEEAAILQENSSWRWASSGRVGLATQCEKAPFVPGYNLAGEGFDVVRLRRTGAYVINVKGHLADNQTCTLCPNRFHKGQIQRLPAAVLDWRPFSRCSKQLSSALHHSVDSLLRSSNSLVNNNWSVGLSLDKFGKVMLGGSRSDLAKFARSQHSVDKATFAIHEISCTYYSYRLADHPNLSTEFTKHLNRLPPNLTTSHSRALYKRLIDTYGTHYIHQVQLGGKVRRITAFRTCLATLKGFTEAEIKNCLNAELRMALGFLPANASYSNKCDGLMKGNMSMGFYQGFMTHKIEVTGGEKYFPDILYQQDPSDAYHSWMNSLQDNPDVVSYGIFPLHHLVEDIQISANLREIISEYIQENKLQDQLGFKNCSPTPNLDHNCCPLRAGRGSLKLEIHRAAGLKADTFTKTDAYVKIFYNGMYEETETVMDDNNPVWNATYDFSSVEVGQELRFEVWDRDVLYNDQAGVCIIFPERGTRSLSCQLRKGVLYFSYSIKCDAHLSGFRCGRYSPTAE